MTKTEAETVFRGFIMPALVEREAQQSGNVDEPLRAQAWNDYTDGLCKDGQITDSQFSNWLHPRFLFNRKG